MTTEDLIENFIELGVSAYKKNSGNCLIARKLNRHEPVVIQGQEFCYWREYATFKMAEYLIIKMPELNVSVNLDGNNSTIQVELTDAEQQKLNRILFIFLKSIGEY